MNEMEKGAPKNGKDRIMKFKFRVERKHFFSPSSSSPRRDSNIFLAFADFFSYTNIKDDNDCEDFKPNDIIMSSRNKKKNCKTLHA